MSFPRRLCIVIATALLVANLFLLCVRRKGRPISDATDTDDEILEHRLPHSEARNDCHPDQSATADVKQRNCVLRGCIWQAKGNKCFYPLNFQNYRVTDVTRQAHGMQILMAKTERASGFRDDMEHVRLSVTGIGDDVVDLHIQEYFVNGSESGRWQPPIPLLNFTASRNTSPQWDVSFVGPRIRIHRRTTGTLIFDFDARTLIFSDQFLQLIVSVPSKALYGFGERTSRHRKTVTPSKHRFHFPFHNNRHVDDPGSYGSHPFYLMYEPGSSDAHGVLFFNSNACDATLTSEPSIVWRTIGGEMRFLLFMGPNAVDVVRQKAAVIGHSPLPAYWTLGFGLSRREIASVTQLAGITEANIAAGIPVQTVWLDSFHLEKYNCFVPRLDWQKPLLQMTEQLHSNNRSLVVIVNSEFSATEASDSAIGRVYRRGSALDLFMKTEVGTEMRIENRNPVSVIPDFSHPNVSEWWTSELRLTHQKLPYDGLWIDTNEPSTHDFRDGKRCPESRWDRPQYNPVHPRPLEESSVCLNSRHYSGSHYDLHNIFALLQSAHTFHALKSVRQGKRPFILSRATTTGSSAYVAHWTGDIFSTWRHMRLTIPAILDFNLFGIPLIGADICGYYDDTSMELCARWHSLGAFYPFARNHNGLGKPQDPVSMGPVVVKAARRALRLRYQLLPLLYTLFHENSVSGAPVVRSLKMNFPSDGRTDDIDQQFMWGHSLLISPVLRPAVKRLTAYFPAGVWYDVRTGRVVSHSVSGKTVTLNVPITEISVTLMGGQVIAVKENRDSNGKEVQTTADHRDIAFSLIVGLDGESRASGRLYWDDGDGDRTDGKYFLIDFDVRDRCLKTTVSHSFDYSGEKSVHQIRVFGLQAKSGVTVTASSQVLSKRHCDTEYNRNTGVAVVTLPHGLTIDRKFTVCWTLR